MTEEQEEELMEFANNRIAKHRAKSRLRLGGNIDNFSSDKSQVLFLDKPNLPDLEQEEPWTVLVETPNVITTAILIEYTDGNTFESTVEVPSFPPTLISYREGDAAVRALPGNFVVANYEVGFPGAYEGTVNQTIVISFSIQNFSFGVRVGLRKFVETFGQGQPSEPVSDDIVFIDLPSADVVVYEEEPAINTRVTLTPVSITRL